MADPHPEIASFNERATADATVTLQAVCASVAWQRVLVASRPFRSLGELAATSDGVLTALGWNDVQDALAADPGVTPEAVAGSEEAVTYEARFGVPFLIDPTGKTADQLRGALAERLANDDEVEQRTVRRELAAVVRVRLAKAFG